MPITLKKTAYRFDELSDDAKERARQWWRECDATDGMWSEFVIDDAATIADMLGINLRTRAVKLMGGGTRHEPCIWWAGFWSQGDGACFEGSYSYRKGSVADVMRHAPKDETLHRIARDLYDAQKRNFFQLNASISHRGHYYHSGCMAVNVERDSATYQDNAGDGEEEIRQALRDFADWIYRQLRDEYEYHNADEQVDEAIRCNEYLFDEDGDII